jgi:pSer/pThr/pTyr-binding forkhead associated (FHA) protein
MSDDPVAVLLQLAFVAVLYLFLFWVARSSLKDLRRATARDDRHAPRGLVADEVGAPPLIVVEGGGGLRAGAVFAVNGTMTIGRSPQTDVQIDDSFASARHARVIEREGLYYLEDMGSTNGTYLNGRRVSSLELLRPEDRFRIGDTEFRYQQ